MGRISTHILDISHGRPAAGVAIRLLRQGADGLMHPLKTVRSNADGRTNEPLLTGAEFTTGVYELQFHVGDYFAALGLKTASPPFLDIVPLRFTVSETDGHYHVPLLCSPWSYSTYRGS